MNLQWGVDLGGTKIEGTILNPADPVNPIARQRIETQAHRGYTNVLAQIAELLKQLSQKISSKPDVIGFATPGVIDSVSGTLKNSNTQCLNGMPLKADLENLLGLEVRMANDANCFALAETLFGAAKGANNVFGIIMGTGVGGGVVIDGKALQGHHGIAGEWGHNVIIENGEPCYCGKRGCVETVLSGPALEKFYTSISGEALSLTNIALKAAAETEGPAQATMQRLLEYFGKAVSVIINILDPEVIVLGGGVSNIDLLYKQAPAEIQKSIFNNRVTCKILKHSLGDSAGVLGAAMLAANGQS